jgi:hypothetical protein
MQNPKIKNIPMFILQSRNVHIWVYVPERQKDTNEWRDRQYTCMKRSTWASEACSIMSQQLEASLCYNNSNANSLKKQNVL